MGGLAAEPRAVSGNFDIIDFDMIFGSVSRVYLFYLVPILIGW